MIYSLTGKITMLDEDSVIVDTGVLAYQVICSSFAAYELSNKSEKQTILTYLQVREDAMTLYGFKDKNEKQIFNELINVSGIGPKMAISILSGLKVSDIVEAILNSDVKKLSSIKGLGKKTAERIVLELRNKLGGTQGIEDIISDDIKISSSKTCKQIEEATEVLFSMGISKVQATEIAKQNYTSGMTGEELVVKCLKNLK